MQIYDIDMDLNSDMVVSITSGPFSKGVGLLSRGFGLISGRSRVGMIIGAIHGCFKN